MLAILPLIFFVIAYLGYSIAVGDFYKMPVTVAFMLTAIVAVLISRGRLSHRIKVFSRGAASENLMLMIWIFVLAGAFANSAKEMGSVQDVVNLTLNILPSEILLAGLFFASALISLSIGTSVGTIVALMPIGVGIAEMLNSQGNSISTAFVAAIVIGGAFFGDNLSFISDTTVCATQSQGCKMVDKFKMNIRIAGPAAIIVFAIYCFMGSGVAETSTHYDVNYLKVIPYLVVLITAILGVNVLIVLTAGIFLTGIVGLITGDYTLDTWFAAMGSGVTGMGELIIVTILAGGILELIRANGGIKFLINGILKHVRSKRSAELSIAALVSCTDLCTANNTVAIITVSGIAKDISNRFGLDPRRVASILDTFSCIMQGIIPYGAQLLMGAALASLNPIEIIPYLYYPYVLLAFAIGGILLRRGK